MSEKRPKMKPPRRSSQDSETTSSSESTSSPSSEDEEIDARDLKPIKEYLNDRRDLASQLFKSVKLEKIRMMLPQVLKNIDLYDIEEWCGNELSGMSRKRIMSIINGQRMPDSSDTEETDDSGPSLEIISDTEEWLTDDDVIIKEENTSEKSKRKKNIDKVKGKSVAHSKDKAKLTKTTTNQGKNKTTDANVKIEGEKPEAKEGESLLDLLELEMRARAIRALIRKEEDIIPDKNSGSTKTNPSALANASASTSKYIVQEMQQISVTLKQGSGLDDDVMLVIQPAPTIELLSSESENEKGNSEDQSKRVNKKLANERRKEEEEKLAGKVEIGKEEQSKRVNKRLENERGTETTHSTSTNGDETIEIIDNDDSKVEENSLLNNKNQESESVVKIDEKLQKSPEKEQVKKSDKVPDKSENKESNKLSDKPAEKGLDKAGNTTDKVEDSTNKVEENKIEKREWKKVSDLQKETVDESKITNNLNKDRERENIPNTEKSVSEIGNSISETVKNVSEIHKDISETENKVSETQKDISESPKNVTSASKCVLEVQKNTEVEEKPKSPEKELEEGELPSDNDSKEEEDKLEKIDRNNKKQKRLRKGRRRRSKVSESSQEDSEDLDQSECLDSEKRKFKLRKKIRDNTANVKEITSKETENEIVLKKNSAEFPTEKEEVQSEDKGSKEEPRLQKELQKTQEDFDKADMDEIIDLDDYPDDMDDLENNQPSDLKKSNSDKTDLETGAEKTEPTETWASRYYNTDDVQNVIKESKIQSEIRKRLRERQRLSKLNNSPNINKSGSDSPIDIKIEEANQKPLGSVEEYLALKAATSAAAAAAVVADNDDTMTDSSVNKKSSDEKSRKSHKKRDSANKIKSHSSKKKSKSDKKSSKDDVNSSVKTKIVPESSNVELRPD